MDDAVRWIIASLDHDTACALATSRSDELHCFHLGLGMAIRNHFGLWQMQGELYDALSHRQGVCPLHPYEASAVLLRLARRELRRQHRLRRVGVRAGRPDDADPSR